MKLKSNIILLGSIIILASGPAAFARGKGQGHKSAKAVAKNARMVFDAMGDDAVVSGPAGIYNSDDGQGDGQEANDGSGEGDAGNGTVEGTSDGDGNVNDDGSVSDSGSEGENGEPILDKDPDGGGTAVPVDWVKRGDHPEGDPNVIFYNMASGPLASGAAKGNVVRGQADKGAAIEANEGTTAPLINREKKGPVALVKKGRVFLR